jgi:hypothetical protein
MRRGDAAQGKSRVRVDESLAKGRDAGRLPPGPSSGHGHPAPGPPRPGRPGRSRRLRPSLRRFRRERRSGRPGRHSGGGPGPLAGLGLHVAHSSSHRGSRLGAGSVASAGPLGPAHPRRGRGSGLPRPAIPLQPRLALRRAEHPLGTGGVERRPAPVGPDHQPDSGPRGVDPSTHRAVRAQGDPCSAKSSFGHAALSSPYS